MTSGDGETVTLRFERQLATLEGRAPGTRIQVADSSYVFYCAGRIKPEVARLLGWEQENVWLPEPALEYMMRRHLEFSDHIRAMSLVLANPSSVYIDDEGPDRYRFYADADQLRAARTLRSSSVSTVDALIELRQAGGQFYIRAFHLSPTRKLQGARLWP